MIDWDFTFFKLAVISDVSLFLLLLNVGPVFTVNWVSQMLTLMVESPSENI